MPCRTTCGRPCGWWMVHGDEDYAKVLDKMGVDHLDRVLAATARMNGMINAILAQAQLAGAPLQT